MRSSTSLKLDRLPFGARTLLRGLGVGVVAVLVAVGALDVLTRLAEQHAAQARPFTFVVEAAELLVLGLGLLVATAHVLGFRRRAPVDPHVQQLESLAEAALRDNLTRLGNHRAFQEDFKRESERRNRSGSCFSVVMLDLDGLKQTNDTLGHLAGDERIRAVADSLRATVRDGQTAYRTGGDEFMALLPDARAWGAMTFAQRLQTEVAKRHTGLGVTCGIAESTGLESRDTILRQADLALYAAKDSHRHIVIYSEGLDPGPAKAPPAHETRHQHRIMATALARAVDAKDSGTRNHCETVSELCALIGQRLGLEGDRIEELRLAGLLHDVGKIGVPDAVLHKQEGLDEDEVGEMRSHVSIGHAIVSAAELEQQATWILHHHEHVDGSGYPKGLRGDEIPLESKIILVADAFEAMTSNRPYRDGRSPEAALAELARHSGTQFDRACIAALESTLATAGPEASVEGNGGGASWPSGPHLRAIAGDAALHPVEPVVAAASQRAARAG